MADYAKKTVAELQEILKSRSLPHTGKKAELVARLNENDQEQNEAEAPVGEEEIEEEGMLGVYTGFVVFARLIWIGVSYYSWVGYDPRRCFYLGSAGSCLDDQDEERTFTLRLVRVGNLKSF